VAVTVTPSHERPGLPFSGLDDAASTQFQSQS
jgi:hypothetical protein